METPENYSSLEDYLNRNKVKRRDFLRNFLKIGAGITSVGVLTSAAGAVSLTSTAINAYSSYEEDLSAFEPYEIKYEHDARNAPTVSKLEIGNSEITLFGSDHSPGVALNYKNSIERLIKESDYVVLERPPTLNDLFITDLATKCHRHHKPVFHLDNFHVDGLKAESYAGYIGAIVCGYGGLKRKIGRREVLAFGIGLIAWANSYWPSKLARKVIIGDEGINASSMLLFNHLVDHRNVEVAERLSLLSDRFSERKSLSVFYAQVHTKGIEFYLKNPSLRKLKKWFYSINYGRLDTDKSYKYTPTGSSWDKEELWL
jgi:hypothetical protein